MNDSSYWVELRLMIEEMCCDLCRFDESSRLGCLPEDIRIYRELPLGQPDSFADIMIHPPGGPAFFVEVKFGYSDESLLASLRRKYSHKPLIGCDVDKVVLVLNTRDRPNADTLIAQASATLAPGLRLEVWDGNRLAAMLRSHFGVEVTAIDRAELLEVRTAIDHAKGWHAFGDGPQESYTHDPLKAQLLWNFGFWKLRELRAAAGGQIHEILKPGIYRNVAILIADLCSFSSFVRDTPDPDIMRESLVAFYSKTRYEILNNGGMHYQFVGDQVIGLFGLPDQPKDYLQNAFRTARSLCAIGKSVSQHWHRKIDRVQERVGLHIGLSIGDLHMLPLRPFSRIYQGFIGDSINMAARLMAEAAEDEIVATNSFYRRLDPQSQTHFAPIQAVNAKNVGLINAWRTRVAPGTPNL
jgi:class 3 adenylate cyclase